MVGIREFKAEGHTIIREERWIDVSNGQQNNRYIIENFTPNKNGEKIFVNNHEGRFTPWAHTKGEYGGVLWWVQDGIYIEMVSRVLSKEKMMELAKSME